MERALVVAFSGILGFFSSASAYTPLPRTMLRYEFVREKKTHQKNQADAKKSVFVCV